MAESLVHLVEQVSRLPDHWLIGHDHYQFSCLTEALFQELTQLRQEGTLPKILLAEREPVKFLAGLIAACAAGCPVFLGNHSWVKQEWQQVLELIQPDIIWGQVPFRVNSGNQDEQQLGNTLIQNRVMIPTGGSSGKIRFVIHSWETLTASVRGFQQYFQLKQVNSFCVLPLYHVSGLMQFLRSFISGGQLVILPFKALETGEKLDINPAEFFISLVPTQLQRLLQNPASQDWLSHFQTILLGGAPGWPELLKSARHQGIRLALTYGTTETASQIATLKPEDFLAGNNSCGQILPHAQVTIQSPNGDLLGFQQTGIITIQADSLMLGYYPDSPSPQKPFQLDDLGFFDHQGYLNVVGRNSHKIITGGENVFPGEVEAAILDTQLVADICVIGIPDHNWGQVITAVYVPSHSEVSTTTLQTALKEKLSKFKQPKSWVSVASLPRNAQGKVNREQLRQFLTTES